LADTLRGIDSIFSSGLASDLIAEQGWSELVPELELEISDPIAEIVWRDTNSSLVVERQRSSADEIVVLRFGKLGSATIFVSQRKLFVCAANHEVTRETLDHFLLDQVIPRIIAHEGDLVVHAGLIANPSAGVAVSGLSGRGKSTLVASLRQAGFMLHGDDAIVIEAGGPPFVSRSVYPGLRVLPDTLERLFPKGPKVRTVAHYSDKLRVSLSLQERESLRPVPLTALLFLAPPPADAEIRLRPMRPAEACMALIENSFALDPTDKEKARDRLVIASDLATSVPAFELSYPRDYARLEDVRVTLVEAGILPPVDTVAVKADVANPLTE
jgi:hypothetical protein